MVIYEWKNGQGGLYLLRGKGEGKILGWILGWGDQEESNDVSLSFINPLTLTPQVYLWAMILIKDYAH